MHTLFVDNYEKVYKLAYSILLDDEMAKEISQESFLKAFNKYNSLKDRDNFTYWITKSQKPLYG